MDALWKHSLLGCVIALGMLAQGAWANNVMSRTRNFVVISAPSAELARVVGEQAEAYRRELAMHWLGEELPPWSAPCTIRVIAGNRPAEGATHYNRYPGRVGDFQMEVVGTPERILDSVLPHEVTHTVLASHFGRPLPRWADEGIATTVEHVAEKSKHEGKLREFLTTGRGIPMNQMFMMREYPPEMLTLYAQGYSVCQFLIRQRGPREFVDFLESYFERRSWTHAVQDHYQYASLGELQDYWLGWVRQGGGDVAQFAKAGAGSTAGPGAAALALGDGRPSDPPSVRLASGAGEGWYVKGGAVAGNRQLQPGGSSVYSAAQPSGPQGVGSGIPVGASSTWAPVKRR